MQKLKYLLINSRILLVLLLLAVFAGCSNDDDDKMGSTGATARDGTLEKLFSYPVIQGCQTCHYGSGSGPDLSKANFASNLVGKNSTNYNWSVYTKLIATCGIDTDYVDADRNAGRSSVLNSIAQTYDDSSCISAISHHEVGNAVLSDAALEDFILWIEGGTPAN